MPPASSNLALIAVPALALTQTITTAVALLATTVLMMGGTGTPLAPGTQAVTARYSGDQRYQPAQRDFTFTVLPSKYSLSAASD